MGNRKLTFHSQATVQIYTALIRNMRLMFITASMPSPLPSAYSSAIVYLFSFVPLAWQRVCCLSYRCFGWVKPAQWDSDLCRIFPFHCGHLSGVYTTNLGHIGTICLDRITGGVRREILSL